MKESEPVKPITLEEALKGGAVSFKSGKKVTQKEKPKKKESRQESVTDDSQPLKPGQVVNLSD